MMANQSPSYWDSTVLSRYYAVAFQANTTTLTIDPDLGAVNRGLGMMANTSPSIAHEYSNYYSVRSFRRTLASCGPSTHFSVRLIGG